MPVVGTMGAAAEVPGSSVTGCSCLDKISETLSEEGFDMVLDVDRVEGEVESNEDGYVWCLRGVEVVVIDQDGGVKQDEEGEEDKGRDRGT